MSETNNQLIYLTVPNLTNFQLQSEITLLRAEGFTRNPTKGKQTKTIRENKKKKAEKLLAELVKQMKGV